jgi:hypothetical protein
MVDLSFITGLNDRKLTADLDLLEAKYDIALAALTALGNQQTSGGGQASQMAFHAREALKKINGVKND